MSCSLGIQKTVEKILGNKPWFNYNQAESYIEISESPNKKINPSNFFSVAQTVSQAINKQINKGDKRIGDISYPTYINNSPVVKIAPTKAQLDLLNAEDQQEILELEKEIAQEKQQEEFNQLEKESNSINVEGEVQPIFFQLNKNTNEVAYALKAMDILQSPKGDEVFRKGDKNNWTIDKILQELQVPKEQQELIKSFNTRNREEILTSLLANYSYAIEINTVKEPSNVQKSGYWNNNEDYISGTNEIVRDFDDRDIDDDSRNYWFTDRYGNIYSRDKNKYFKNQKEIRESLWEAEKNSINRQLRAKELNLTNPKPTQYYSNLTVPGGTNYTENEISTPLITPSIKGHAQFATDNGIGWFRADEQLTKENLSNDLIISEEDGIFFTSYQKEGSRSVEFIEGSSEQEVREKYSKLTNIKKEKSTIVGDTSNLKTRRILEVQSDLFQKGRDKDNLINEYSEEYQNVDGNTIDEIIENRKNIKSNQFLQLLNKDNNWVTFFVKSIIQDSAKKGYEKVLFPSGNTASKVEGHTTLEEFKKQKEDRLAKLENSKYILIDENVYQGNYDSVGSKFKTLEQVEEYRNKEDYRKNWKILDISDKYVTEINQLKQELERVEGPEGFAALKPIYNFYENTVTNILNKTYGKENVKVITDEYGNTWNQITVDNNRDRKSIFFQNKSSEEINAIVASEKTIRDLAAKLAHRIGYNVTFEADKSKNYKGKLQGNTAVINLANATLDTPIHEILGHPIIRAIKNKTVDGNTYKLPEQMSDGSGWAIQVYTKNNFEPEFFKTEKEAFDFYNSKQTQLYQNLLKELETGKGKEVLDRIKRDYRYKGNVSGYGEYTSSGGFLPGVEGVGTYKAVVNGEQKEFKNREEALKAITYTLEEQQEEAIVELLGLMTAEKLDAVKDGKLISLLKRLLKEIKAFMKDILFQKEVEIDKLPDNMTINDLSDLLAYSNSKLILPGYEVEYTTPDNMKFKTYQEASNHISKLTKSVKDVDLDSIDIKYNEKQIPESFTKYIYKGDDDIEYNFYKLDNKYYKKTPGSQFEDGVSRSKEITEEDYLNEFKKSSNGGFNKDTQSFNSLKDFVDKNKEYEQSKEIIEEWKKVNNIQYNPEEIYSRGQEFSSVVGAYSSFDVNLMMQNLLSHIEDNEKAGGKFAISAYTKPIDKQIGHLEGGGGKIKFKLYPQSNDILWAANTDVYSGSVWDASEKVNKDKKSELLGVSYTKYPSLRSINTVQPNLATIVDDLAHHHNELGIVLTGNNFRLEYDEDIPYTTKKIIDGINKILDQKYGKLVKSEISKTNVWNVFRDKEYKETFNTEKEAEEFIKKQNVPYLHSIKKEVKGIQPTQTNETLKESIENINSKFKNLNNGLYIPKEGQEIKVIQDNFYKATLGKYRLEAYDINTGKALYGVGNEVFDTEKEAKDFLEKAQNQKEYTQQALINTKIAALKEVAKKQPRSLIRSEVKPINRFDTKSYEQFDELDDLPFQKIPSKSEEVVKEKASPKLISLMKEFIKGIGVDYKLVSDVVVDGVKQDANGVALIMQKLIQVVEGKEDEALPEEAMHFAVEIIKQTNKSLYQQLLKEINGHTTLKQVVEEYGNNPFYQKDGKRDYLKLKEEAIAQVLANRLEDVIGRTWWEKISDYLKGLFFGKSGFDQAIIDVLTGKIESVDNIDSTNNSPYFQLSKGEKVFNDLLSTSNRIKVVPNGVDENGKEKTTYELDDIKADKRVSDFSKLFYEKIFGKGIDESEFNKAVNDLKAEKGTAGHSDLEHAFELFVDPETGLLREEPLDDDNYVSKLNARDSTLYLKLRENLQERLNSFEDPKNPGTRFLSEVKIFDKKRKVAGTVDFVAITPEGKVNILDWKFMDLNTDKYEDVPWYKVRAWDIQMKKYKDIIATNYNVKNEEFGQTRMIPILAKYTKANFEKEILPRLLSIKIGDVNVQNIEEDYLLPVGITEEKTGNKKIDTLISKLNSVYKKLSEEKVGETEKTAKAEQLNALYKAIRHLQIKGNVVPLINQAKILNKQVSVLLKKYAVEFEGQTPETIDQDKVNAFAGIIRIHLEALEPYLDLKQLRFLLEDETEENIKLKEELRKTIEKVEDYISELQDLDKEFGEKFNNTSSTPEKVVKGITKWFSSISTIQVGNIQTLYKLANKAFALAGQETLDEVKKLNIIKENYDRWASSRNLSKGNYFSALIKKNKNELIDEFDPEFYKTLKDKIAKKDFDWILDNTDKLAYKEYIDNKKEKEIDRIFSRPRIGTEEEVKAIIGREIAKVYDKYDIDSTDSKGWLLYDDVKKFPIRELWESKEYKELNKPENSPAKDFYNYIVERNKYYQEIGYLNGKPTRKFLPWIKQGFIEGLVFDGKTRGLGEEFLRNISMDEGEAGYGQTDPITGELINSVPRYFTKDLGEGYSTDLFKTMSLYNEYAIKFKNITDIEERALQLLRAERNKKSIMSSKFGQMIKEGDEPKYNETNLENSKLLDDMIKGIIYQQKFVESEVFDVALGKISGFGKNLNEKLGMKIFPEDLENRQISLNKSINTLNTHFQVVTLGLNTLSSISNLFGGTANGLINSGKYFTKTDFLKTQMWLLTNKMKGRMFGKESLEENPAKALAALDYFLPFVENYNRYAATKLSLNKLDEQNIQDYLMVLMRKGDEAVQTLNFFAFLKNAIVVDGKIINVREYLKKTPKYQNFYTGTQTEREQKVKDFEKDVEELLDTQSVLKLGELKDGEFSIPTVDKKSDSVIEFRRLVQSFTSDALGSMSEENRRLVNMNVYSSSAMVFKNWIPRLVDVRIGNIKYNAASDAYEWGRMRMLFGMITTDVFKSINSLKAALSGDSDIWLEQVKELYEKKKIDYYNNTGKELEMTEDEFISLVNQNIKNQALDLAVLLSLVSFLCILKAIPPDDEDPIVKNQYKFLLKATDKLTDELSYFYNPSSPFNLISQGIFPSLALLENYSKILKNFTKENYGIITGDEKMQDDAHPIKYIMKSFPLTNQAQQLLPLFYPELAKDLGIRMQSQYNRK